MPDEPSFKVRTRGWSSDTWNVRLMQGRLRRLSATWIQPRVGRAEGRSEDFEDGPSGLGPTTASPRNNVSPSGL